VLGIGTGCSDALLQPNLTGPDRFLAFHDAECGDFAGENAGDAGTMGKLQEILMVILNGRRLGDDFFVNPDGGIQLGPPIPLAESDEGIIRKTLLVLYSWR